MLDLNLPNDVAKATDKQIEEVGEMINENGGLDSGEMFLNDADDVKDYLDGEIDLDDIDTGGVAHDMLTQLKDEYNLSKSEIKEYLKKNNLLPEDLPPVERPWNPELWRQ